MGSLRYLIITVTLIYLCYFFSGQFKNAVEKFKRWYVMAVGKKAVAGELSLQRYVYLHRTSLLAKGYRWVSRLISAMGIKTSGVTPTGFVFAVAFVNLFVASGVNCIVHLSTTYYPLVYLITFVVIMATLRVIVSERLELIESDVLDAIDLIIPDIADGTKNSIDRYINNFKPSVKPYFLAFKVNVEDRGMPFNDAIIVLADGLGDVFLDFAQKAIYYEENGTVESLEMFDTVVESNRHRRTQRSKINRKFKDLAMSTIMSSIIILVYLVGVILFDEFTRNFFLNTTGGKFALLGIILIVFYILSSFITLRSKAL